MSADTPAAATESELTASAAGDVLEGTSQCTATSDAAHDHVRRFEGDFVDTRLKPDAQLLTFEELKSVASDLEFARFIFCMLEYSLYKLYLWHDMP